MKKSFDARALELAQKGRGGKFQWSGNLKALLEDLKHQRSRAVLSLEIKTGIELDRPEWRDHECGIQRLL